VKIDAIKYKKILACFFVILNDLLITVHTSANQRLLTPNSLTAARRSKSVGIRQAKCKHWTNNNLLSWLDGISSAFHYIFGYQEVLGTQKVNIALIWPIKSRVLKPSKRRVSNSTVESLRNQVQKKQVMLIFYGSYSQLLMGNPSKKTFQSQTQTQSNRLLAQLTVQY